MIRVGMCTSMHAELTRAKEGADVLSVLDFSKLIERCAEKGVQHFELSFDLNLMLDDAFNERCMRAVERLQREHCFTCSVHLPFRGFDLSYPAGEMAEGAAKLFARLIRLSQDVNPIAYVIHPAGPTAKMFRATGQGSLMGQKLADALSFAIERIGIESGMPAERLALENVSFPFWLNIAAMDRTPVSMCLDIGHAIADASGDRLSPEALLTQYGSRIIASHLHDVSRTESGTRDHLPMGAGQVDFDRIARALVCAGYESYIIMELKADESVTVDSVQKFAACLRAAGATQ